MRHRAVVAVALLCCISFVAAAYFRFPSKKADAVFRMMNDATLVIDPGHGGEDGGTVSAKGRKEGDVNLLIGKRLYALSNLLGVPAVMSRTEDCSLQTGGGSFFQRKVSDLKNRVRFVHSVPNAILVSIHQNHFPDPRYHGAQVFYAASEESRLLADSLQHSLAKNLDPQNHRRCKPAKGIYLLEHCDCTAVLVECGFFSNPQEEELLHNEDYQKKLSLAIMTAMINFRCEAKKS